MEDSKNITGAYVTNATTDEAINALHNIALDQRLHRYDKMILMISILLSSIEGKDSATPEQLFEIEEMLTYVFKQNNG